MTVEVPVETLRILVAVGNALLRCHAEGQDTGLCDETAALVRESVADARAALATSEEGLR